MSGQSNLSLVCSHTQQTHDALSLVWNGAEFVCSGGSDTDGSDSEQPLTPSEHVVALVNIRAHAPPPLPVEKKHARATAQAVLNHICAIPIGKRRGAHRLALSLPLQATTIAEWIEQQLRAHRREHTLKTALCVALNPSRTEEWVCSKSGGTTRVGHMHIVKGLALHLRMHPFTWHEVKEACDMLTHKKPRALDQIVAKDAATLQAAVGLVCLGGRPS